jgi:hypothetical protein
MRRVAALSALTLLITGCYTGYGRAESRRALLTLGMTQAEVQELLGEPDQITQFQGRDVVVEWSYSYTTPFTMFIVPTLGLFTVVLSVPSAYYLLGLTWGGTTIWLRVEFGLDQRLLRAHTDLNY